MDAAGELWVCHLGTLEYREALALQERLRDARQHELLPDVLLTLEHWPVYTRGRRSGSDELPMGEEWYRMQGFDIVQTDRGGKLTYHGPGSWWVIRSSASTMSSLMSASWSGPR